MRCASGLVLAVALLAVGSPAAGSPQDPPKKETAGPKASDRKVTDPDAVVAQSGRWTLRFRTKSGKDYVGQLAAVGCSVLVPVPSDNKKCLLFENLNGDPPKGRPATDEDFKTLAAQARFADRREESVKSVAEALGVEGTPKLFYAFFPKEVREGLAKLEKEYAKDIDVNEIQETVFTVAIKDGKPVFTVVEQKLKKDVKK